MREHHAHLVTLGLLLLLYADNFLHLALLDLLDILLLLFFLFLLRGCQQRLPLFGGL